jgi:hypothetical protein
VTADEVEVVHGPDRLSHDHSFRPNWTILTSITMLTG